MKVNGQALSDTRRYSLATTTFVALDGGDGYAMLKGSTILTAPERLPYDFEALKQSIEVLRSISPQVEGRIKRVDKPQAQGSNCQ